MCTSRVETNILAHKHPERRIVAVTPYDTAQDEPRGRTQHWHLLGPAWLFRQPCLAGRLVAKLSSRLGAQAVPSPLFGQLLSPKEDETPAALTFPQQYKTDHPSEPDARHVLGDPPLSRQTCLAFRAGARPTEFMLNTSQPTNKYNNIKNKKIKRISRLCCTRA